MRLRTTAAVDTYHVHDLYQTEGEDNGERVGVIAHRPLHPVVILQEVLQQVPLVRTLQRHWRRRKVREDLNLTKQATLHTIIKPLHVKV